MEFIIVRLNTFQKLSDSDTVQLINADMKLFVDDSALKDPATGRSQVGFDVTTLYDKFG